MRTVQDWLVALAAYAYEVEDDPIMSDFTYDKMSGLDTGMWVRELDQDLLKKLLDKARTYYPDKRDIHHPQVESALKHYGVDYVVLGY